MDKKTYTWQSAALAEFCSGMENVENGEIVECLALTDALTCLKNMRTCQMHLYKAGNRQCRPVPERYGCRDA